MHSLAAFWESSEKALGCCFRAGQVTSTAKPFKLQLHRNPGDSPEATAAAAKAASAEASANADSSNASAYGKDALLAVATEADDLIATVTVASAASLSQVGFMHVDSLGPVYIWFFSLTVLWVNAFRAANQPCCCHSPVALSAFALFASAHKNFSVY